MATFDPRKTESNWAGIAIQGAMDGEFFNAEHQENLVELHMGSQGNGTFVFNANQSGIITVTLIPSSITNAQLSAAARAKQRGPWLTKELDDVTTVVTSAQVMIMKHAPIKKGNKLIGMEWKFICEKLELNIASKTTT